MKRYLVAAVIILLFLGLFVLILFKILTPPKAATQGTTFPGAAGNTNPAAAQAPAPPDAVTIACYKWYLGTLAQPGSTSNQDYTSHLNTCFTNEFVASWPTGEDLDNDPVLLSQDYQPSWLSSVTASVVRENGTTSEVVLELGTQPTSKQLQITLTNTNGEWLISNIQSAQ